jgi:hypothetical protein
MRAVSWSSLALAVLVTVTGCDASGRGGGFDGNAPGDDASSVTPRPTATPSDDKETSPVDGGASSGDTGSTATPSDDKETSPVNDGAWGFGSCSESSCVEALESCQAHVACTELADCLMSIATPNQVHVEECVASNQATFGEFEFYEAYSLLQAIADTCCEVCSSLYVCDPSENPPVSNTPGSCEGRCGMADLEECSCNESCFTIGDCCPDVCDVCGPC